MLLWDVRTALEEQESRTIQDILTKNRSKESYYILVHANWTGNGMDVLKTKYLIMDKKPPRMLGTKLYLVNNIRGTLEQLWELPLDVLVPTEYLNMHIPNVSVHDDAKTVAPVICVS